MEIRNNNNSGGKANGDGVSFSNYDIPFNKSSVNERYAKNE